MKKNYVTPLFEDVRIAGHNIMDWVDGNPIAAGSAASSNPMDIDSVPGDFVGQ